MRCFDLGGGDVAAEREPFGGGDFACGGGEFGVEYICFFLGFDLGGGVGEDGGGGGGDGEREGERDSPV